MTPIGLVLGLGVGAGFVIWLLMAGRARGVEAPSCGQCWYRVQGLTTFTCPECGSDLREVGIITPTFRRRTGPVGRAVIFSLLLILPAIVITRMVAMLLPRVRTQTRDLDLMSPQSQAYTRIAITATGTGTEDPVRPDEITIELEPLSGPTVRMRKTAEQMGDLTVGALLAWMGEAGIDTGSEAVRSEAKAVLAVLPAAATPGGQLRAPAGGAFRSSGSGTTGSGGQPPAWYGWVALSFWLVVWLAGVRKVVKPRPAPEAAE